MENSYLSLFQFNSLIKETINSSFDRTYWIIAEISDINENRSGHAYLELIEKDVDSDKILAKSKATIWSTTYRMLKPYFESSAGHEFSSGIKILINVSVEYHEVYGMSLNIRDIDPSYTLGDIEKRKKEIILRLENEGVIDLNKSLEFPIVPQKIAIISSETAAGYGDFINQLKSNKFGYRYYLKLFPAIMQGEKAEGSIIEQLDKIYQNEQLFDVVVIIRGGGAKSDLSCFDSYLLASNIAQFPIPVLSGIGHERDQTIVDMVSHLALKTPTAVAEFIISCVNEFNLYLIDKSDSIIQNVTSRIQLEKSRNELLFAHFAPAVNKIIQNKENYLMNSGQAIFNLSARFLVQKRVEHALNVKKISYLPAARITIENQKIKSLSENIKLGTKYLIINERHLLEFLGHSINFLNPLNILKRGYSITKLNGRAVKSIMELVKDDVLETQLKDGIIESRVTDFKI